MKRVILASNSPRRIEILNTFNIKFDVIPSEYNEKMLNFLSPYELVCELSERKASNVAQKVGEDCIIIGADTVVYKDGDILGKPSDEKDAFNMLSKLSGDCHKVITGICIIDKKEKNIYKSYEETLVYFKNLTENEIMDYIKTKEPFDKAGAYGIQGFGGLFVEKIEGCYFNVVGFPVNKLYTALGNMGVNLLTGEI
ncbi:septum formation protein [Caloramator quimbayensis]|uniref:dTTP/UTP pyrophosphatase n=1 Tax=Caloramator quimbayensis TaxID=1147123 RepID=A0A1T4XY58_9CLOT|nr:Maf family protein [Caloramator quimbayensis]SKA94509.1 septum formation protein [Caloramator quimbayensis]